MFLRWALVTISSSNFIFIFLAKEEEFFMDMLHNFERKLQIVQRVPKMLIDGR
jgi:hypothetical protein